MGTLPKIRLKELRCLNKLPIHSSLLILLISLLISTEVTETGSSRDVSDNPMRSPYLFRDLGMLGKDPETPLPVAPAQIANLYYFHQLLIQFKKFSQSWHSDLHHHHHPPHRPSSHVEYFDDVIVSSSSSEEDPGQRNTAPMIIDIDEPEKGRWAQGQYKNFADAEQYDDAEDFIEDYDLDGSISSTELHSRSGQPASPSSHSPPSKSKLELQAQGQKPDSSSSRSDNGDKRGILDYFGSPMQMIGIWQANDNDHQDQVKAERNDVEVEADVEETETPQGDGQTPATAYYQYQYQYQPQPKPQPQHPQPQPQYAYVPYHNYYQHPVYQQQYAASPPSPPPPPSPSKAQIKAQQKAMKAQAKAKRKKMKKMMKKKMQQQMMMMKPSMPMYMWPPPPDKLDMLKQKLSKLNPFNYQIEIIKPSIKIQKLPPKMPPMGGWPPPKRKRRKKKKPPPPPPPPAGWPAPPPPPTMPPMMMVKMKPVKMKMKKPKPPKPPKMPKPPKPPKKPPKTQYSISKPSTTETEAPAPEYIMMVPQHTYYAQPQQPQQQPATQTAVAQHPQQQQQAEVNVAEEELLEESDEYDYSDLQYANLGGSGGMSMLQSTQQEDDELLNEDDEADPYEDSTSSGLFYGREANGATRINIPNINLNGQKKKEEIKSHAHHHHYNEQDKDRKSLNRMEYHSNMGQGRRKPINNGGNGRPSSSKPSGNRRPPQSQSQWKEDRLHISSQNYLRVYQTPF